MVTTSNFFFNFSYFLHKYPSTCWEEDEHYAYDESTAKYLMAFNGWVMNDDPLRNFALYPSQVYCFINYLQFLLAVIVYM